jgi:hypothetical protein
MDPASVRIIAITIVVCITVVFTWIQCGYSLHANDMATQWKDGKDGTTLIRPDYTKTSSDLAGTTIGISVAAMIAIMIMLYMNQNQKLAGDGGSIISAGSSINTWM